jgi:HEAT repeats
MTPRDWVEAALIAEGVMLVLALAALFGHAFVVSRRERRWAVPLERGRRALLEVVRTGRVSKPEEAMLRALPARVQIRLFTELVPSLSGQSREQLVSLAREIGLIPIAEEMARGRDWAGRLHGVRLLAAVGGGMDVVPRLLDDPHPAVRAEAVEWVATNPTPDLIDRLVRLLPRTDRYGSFVVRDSLLRVGHDAIPPLARYLDRHEGRFAEPALDVAAGMPDLRFAAAATRLCRDDLPGIRARAAALAGAVGSEEAVGELQALLSDENAEVRAAAATALGRLGHWPSAQAIAPLLRDPAWIVRSQSALALRRLGSPGLLYLRRSLGDDDAFAADIARQVLDLPEALADRERWT